jgi:hypothetical protein
MHLQQTEPPAATALPLAAIAMEDNKDKQGGSPPLSPISLTNVVKDTMGQPLAPKKSTINNQKVKAAKRMAEVWRQLPEEDGNTVMAMATATGMRMAMRTLMATAMAMVTVMATVMTTAMAMIIATATETAVMTSTETGTAMAVAEAATKGMAEG